MSRSLPIRPGTMVTAMAFALVLAACDSSGAQTTASSEVTEALAAPEGGEGFTYRLGMTEDIGKANVWAYFGPDGTANMQYVLGPTKPALFRIAYPGIVLAPDAAAGLPATPVQEGDLWTVTQPIRADYTWSDGSLLTADDIVFTFETVRDARLTFAWLDAYPYSEESSPRLLDVEAIDDFTVKYTFDTKPGAAIWPHKVGVAPIVPRVPWEPVVAAALQGEDPALVLYDADPLEVGDLSGGPMIYNGREEGVSIETVRNPHYANQGFTHQFWADGSYALNGEVLYGDGVGEPVVEYTEGPYVDRTVFTIYADQAAAMLALVNGDIDYSIGLLPVQGELRLQGLEADNLAVNINPTNFFSYLGFNMRRSPGKFRGFRQAMAYFDKENLTSNVLQGAFTPSYVMVPEGNQAWYNGEVADEIASKYRGLNTNERLAAAYAALEGDGFTWETPAVFDDEANLVSPGVGLIDPEGTPVPELEIFNVGSFGPQPAAALWLEDWAEQLGIPAEAKTTDVTTLIAAVWPGIGVEPTFDMYILGWSLGNPAWPTFHESFFHTRNFGETNDGGNATGYSNSEFDALADAMFAETDQQAAYDAVWEMEQMLAADLPYVVLFVPTITEFYNADLDYPFTKTLYGFQELNGLQETVSK